jgi:hypothetical protein
MMTDLLLLYNTFALSPPTCTRYLGIVYSQAAHSFVADLLRHTRRAAREMMR